MEVRNMIKFRHPKGQGRASFSVETQGYVFNGMRLMEGPDGQLYAHIPVHEYFNGRHKVRQQWFQFKDLDMLYAVTLAAREVYEKL